MEGKSELKLLINEVIEYLFEDEKRHFEEDDIPSNDHIYLKLLRLKELNAT
jgi:hypothetical protein